MEKKRTEPQVNASPAAKPDESVSANPVPATSQSLAAKPDRSPKLSPSAQADSTPDKGQWAKGDSTLAEVAPQQKVYRRSAWQHFVRFIAFGGIAALDVGLISSGINHHLLAAHPLSATVLLKEALSYILVLFCNLAVLPSIILEANKAEVTEDKLILNNLLFRSAIPWHEITKVIVPVYLKFAIIRTRRFFHLINKRDIPDSGELLNTITEKAGAASN